MSQENVEVARRLLRAFNDGDTEALLAECDPTVEWEEQSIPGLDPVYRGHEGVRRWAESVWEAEEQLGSLAGRLEKVKETDDTVIASVRFEAEGTSSGARVQMPVHLVLTFRDRKLIRRQVFLTFAEALEAVGLSR
jgi:ketosteroid isomerase-like protein